MKLKFFFDPLKDVNKLVWLSQFVVKNSCGIMHECEQDKSYVFSLAHFLNLTFNFISHAIVSNQSKEPLGPYWRILEIFLSSTNWRKQIKTESADCILGSIFGILIYSGKLI